MTPSNPIIGARRIVCAANGVDLASGVVHGDAIEASAAKAGEAGVLEALLKVIAKNPIRSPVHAGSSFANESSIRGGSGHKHNSVRSIDHSGVRSGIGSSGPGAEAIHD